MMFKKTLITLLAATAGLLAACGGSSEEGDAGGGGAGASSGEFTEVTLLTVPDISGTVTFAAAERGFFAKHGLDVQLRLLSSGADITKGLQAGEAEFGQVATTSVPPARSSGLDLQMVVPIMNDATSAKFAGNLAIIAGASSGIDPNDPSTLEGKEVGVLEGSTPQSYLRAFLEENGSSLDEVDLLNIAVPDQPIALKQGEVDAITPWEPFVSQVVRELGDDAVIVSRGDSLIGYVIGIGATEEVIESNPDVMQSFTEAVSEAALWVRENPEEAAEVTGNYIDGLNLEDASTAISDHVAFDPRISGCTLQAFEVQAKDLFEADVTKQAFTADEMVNTTFTERTLESRPELFEDLTPVSDC